MAVDAQGLTIKTVEELLGDLEADQRANVDAAIVTTPEEPVGQLNGIYADSERQVWEALEVAYNGFNPDAVEGFLQDALCGLTGTVRLKPKRSAVWITTDIDAGTTLISGTDFIAVDGRPDIRFTPREDYTAGLSGPQNVVFVSENLGPIAANAGTLTVIATPKTGWNSVTNADDAVLGRNEESHAALRIRREERLQAQGSATPDAIRSAVEAVEGVSTVTVFENTTDEINVDMMPPHSFEVLVYDGAPPAAEDDAIAQAIWDNRPVGIEGVGTTDGTAQDLKGDDHIVAFSRPQAKPVFMELDLTGTFDATAARQQIAAALTAETNPGDDVLRSRIICIALEVPGVTNINPATVKLDFASSPTVSQDLVIGSRQIATFIADASHIAFV
jgi:uncharacterized phage protein gp47/JayE